ncbi:MAG: hypothetical protein HQ446_12245 [Polaromonas sp.]|nr:hypothetical protein [Polaromonas sp.]
MSIRQLNASYVAEEDRVMLRFTTLANEEYRLWLTRAVVGALMQQTQALAVKKLEQDHSVQQAKAVAQFKQQVLQQEVSYTRFEGAARLPLGAEPVLVKAVQAMVREAQAVLVLQLAKGQSLTLKLGDDLLGKLQLLLHRMNDSARWVLPSVGGSTGTAVPDDQAPKEKTAGSVVSGGKVLH